MENQITIANEVIALDESGRVSLNVLHKLSGTGKTKQPNNWLRLESTQELIAEIQSSDLRTGSSDRCSDLCIAPLVTINGGNNRGTYAHELLAISYAGWISPRFQLQVNQAFLDSKKAPQHTQVQTKTLVDTQEYIELLRFKIEKLENRKPRKAPKPLTIQEKSTIKQLNQQGIHYRNIAKKLNRSYSAVRAVIREH
ncbi:KilA-N domain-containing protein [Pasteurella skyensis]|uniref:KilA-N domain-containing protein n=1 Tax=Phocoenobacter skyensis TaxID=97481 RepID=A0AAJ6NEQ8_9PAST|nr:KilA-N domain-containing protein [Pasteurella skyensis]MDP8171528.1 KilA-N domain-containing protein [Pasteurella skyensis]MDP8175430.1 KilA-N domain-containing protein [Pasteurella skyensis]